MRFSKRPSTASARASKSSKRADLGPSILVALSRALTAIERPDAHVFETCEGSGEPLIKRRARLPAIVKQNETIRLSQVLPGSADACESSPRL